MTVQSAPAIPVTDSLGVPIEVGDRVILNSWGDTRLVDVGARGTVTGFARTRICVDWDVEQSGPIGNVGPGAVGVLRRDGAPGYEGNVGR